MSERWQQYYKRHQKTVTETMAASPQKSSLNSSGDPSARNAGPRAPSLGLTVFALGALLSEGSRREHVKGMPTKGSVSHTQRAQASAHHVIAASILLNADVALGTLRRQKGAIRLTDHQVGSNTNYTKLLVPVPSTHRASTSGGSVSLKCGGSLRLEQQSKEMRSACLALKHSKHQLSRTKPSAICPCHRPLKLNTS